MEMLIVIQVDWVQCFRSCFCSCFRLQVRYGHVGSMLEEIYIDLNIDVRCTRLQTARTKRGGAVVKDKDV